MVFPDSGKVPRASPYLGTTLVLLVFAYGPITVYGNAFQRILLTVHIRYELPRNPRQKFRRV